MTSKHPGPDLTPTDWCFIVVGVLVGIATLAHLLLGEK